MALLEVRLLGPVELAVDGQEVPLTAAKVRALLALLALEAGKPVSAELLADRLWHGEPPVTAASVLRTYISRLRKALPEGRLERAGSGYVLHLGAGELDATRLEVALAHATAPGVPPAQVAAVLRGALSLWRGPPLIELGDDAGSIAEAVRLDAYRWSALEAWADASLELGHSQHVATELAAAVLDRPWSEQLVARLMLALYRCGRQAEALTAYERLRRALVDELGLDPSPELQRLQSRVLEQDPSLEQAPRPADNLPSAATSFVGRAQDVQRLLDALQEHRLVTLVGAGGAGKTRLALEIARGVAAPSDGTWFVELAGRREAGEVAASVMAVLGIAPHPGQEPGTTLTRVLARQRFLLVLDNCEHVRVGCAELASSLLRHAPGATVIATSRSPLQAEGEFVWRVPPLPVPSADADQEQVGSSPAAQLLSERITAARGGRSPSAGEWSSIAALCRQLDGLPLALELVAARATTLSISDLAASVRAQLIAAETEPSGPDHHRSLAACVDWSLADLDEGHRDLLRRVCLLPGPFSTDAAAALAACSVECAALQLGHLSRQSLLEPLTTGRTRFRVLEPVRQVVLSTLDETRKQKCLGGLVRWCVERAEQAEPSLRGPEAARCLDDLEADIHAFRLAIDHGLDRPDSTDGIRIVAAVSGLWAYRGHLVEGERVLRRALSVSDRAPAPLRVRLLLAAGSHSVALGDTDTFRIRVGAALELARAAAAEAPDMLRVLLWAGRAVLLHDEHEVAAQLYDEALTAAVASADESSRASALAGLGDVAAARGDLAAAAEFHLRSLAAFRGAADPHGEGQALLNVAEIDRRARRMRDAESRFIAAARVFEGIADRSCIAASDEGLGRVARDDGRLDVAEHRYHRALAVRRELQQDRLTVGVLRELAVVLAEAGRPLEAAAALGAAADDEHPVADRLRGALGARAYLSAWADGRAGSRSPR